MVVPPKQEKAESQGVAGRRSTRLFISIPIAVSGTDAAGHTFKENTKTLIINKHGAKVATAHQLALGAEVTIENRALARAAKANVVWLGDRASPKEPVEVGLQLSEAQNIWGIEFPPDDWQEGPPIGTGGQRLAKPLPVAPAKAPEATAAPKAPVKPPPPEPSPKPPAASPAVDLSPAPPPKPAPAPAKPAPVPAPTVRSIPLPAQTANAAIDAAMSRFTQLTEAAAATHLKSFEEELAKLTNQFGSRTQTSLQQAADHLQVKTLGSLEQQLGALEGRLRASREETEALLAKFQQLKEGQSEVEKTQRSIKEASQQAVQSAIEGLQGQVRKELEGAAASFVQQTRQRVQEEASNAMEAFTREASSRVAKLGGEFLSQAAPELQRQQKELTDQAKAQLGEALQGTTSEIRERIRKIAEEETPTVRAELETSLTEYAGQVIGQLIRTFEEQTLASTQAADQSLQRTLEKARDGIQQEIANAAAKVRQSYEEEIAKANQGVSEQIVRSIEQTCKTEADAYRSRLSEVSALSLEGFQNQAATLQESFEARLQKALQKSEEKGTQGVLDKLQKTADDLLDTLAKQLGQHGEETLQVLNVELRTEGKELISGAEKQIRAAIQAGLDSLTLEAQTTSEEYRKHLRKAFEEFRERTLGELELHLVEVSDKQREAILGQVELGIDDALNKALGRLQKGADLIVQQATDTVNKQVGASAVALKDWEEQARARLLAHTQRFEANAQASSEAGLEELRKQSDAFLEELEDRLEQAAHVFEDKSMETIHARLQALTEELVEASASQLRKQTEENLDLAGDQLRERQQQAVSQAEILFRNSLADMLKAVIQLDNKKSAGQESSEREPAKKRL